MDDTSLLSFLRSQRWAIEATTSDALRPQAAIIGYAVTEQLEIVFDTLSTSRKAKNLRLNSHIALVIGGWQDDSPRTLQYEGVADFPAGDELARLKTEYFRVFPDGPSRESLPDITYVRVRPTWMRFSDYTIVPPSIVERQLDERTRGIENTQRFGSAS